MRECIYCGRSLEKGEQCTCAMSVAKRMQREQANAEPEKNVNDKKGKVKKEKVKKERVKRAKTPKYTNMNYEAKNAFLRAWRLFLSFLKSPIDTVMNPGEMSWAVILIMVIAEGIIGGLCVFSVITGAVRGPISLLGNVIGLKGMAGYAVIKGWIYAAISGAVGAVCIFYLLSGIFFAVNKWIMRQFSPYREFVKRFAFVMLPVSILGIVSVVFGLFSQTTFILLLLCGLMGSIIIIYEILRSAWYNKTPGKIIYMMMACMFIFMFIMMKFVRAV